MTAVAPSARGRPRGQSREPDETAPDAASQSLYSGRPPTISTAPGSSTLRRRHATGRPARSAPLRPHLPPAPWPERARAAPRDAPDARSAVTRITFVGHATALIQTRSLNIVRTPSGRSGRARCPLWVQTISPPPVAFDDLPPIDAVLVSHNHYDHLDVVTLERLARRDDPLVVTPLGNDAIVRRSTPRARLAPATGGIAVASR